LEGKVRITEEACSSAFNDKSTRICAENHLVADPMWILLAPSQKHYLYCLHYGGGNFRHYLTNLGYVSCNVHGITP